jgi:hypothetical protein
MALVRAQTGNHDVWKRCGAAHGLSWLAVVTAQRVAGGGSSATQHCGCVKGLLLLLLLLLLHPPSPSTPPPPPPLSPADFAVVNEQWKFKTKSMLVDNNRGNQHSKVEQVAEEAELLRRALERFGGREAARQREADDRAELLARAEVGRRIKDEMDEEAAVAGHVSRSRRYLSDMFEQGTAVLADMASNRERIKVLRKDTVSAASATAADLAATTPICSCC